MAVEELSVQDRIDIYLALSQMSLRTDGSRRLRLEALSDRILRGIPLTDGVRKG